MSDRRKVPGFPRMEVDSLGETYRDGILTIGRISGGYVKIWTGTNEKLRSHLVCLAFHGPRPSISHMALHKNDVPLDDSPDNLYWGTKQDNMRDAINNACWQPRDMAGANHPRAVLDKQSGSKIQEMYASHRYTRRSLSEQFGVSINTVDRIVAGKHWSVR